MISPDILKCTKLFWDIAGDRIIFPIFSPASRRGALGGATLVFPAKVAKTLPPKQAEPTKLLPNSETPPPAKLLSFRFIDKKRLVWGFKLIAFFKMGQDLRLENERFMEQVFAISVDDSLYIAYPLWMILHQVLEMLQR